LGLVQDNLGFLYSDASLWDTATAEFQLAYNYFILSENHDRAAISSIELAEIALQQGLEEEASVNIRRALKHAQLANQKDVLISKSTFYLGLIHRNKGEFQSAKEAMASAYNSSFSLAPYDTETFRMARTLGTFYHQQGLTDLAIQLLQDQLAYLTNTPNEIQLSTLSLLGQLYETQGDLQRALATERRVSDGKLALATAAAQADQARQEAEVALAQKILADEQEVVAFQEKRTEQAWGMGGVIVAFLLVMGWLFWLKEKHRKQAEANTTHWLELNKRFKALEDVLSMMG
ncbi:MAG: tetratricopeptide repeat protein, partial [Bacteroidota bacterium]